MIDVRKGPAELKAAVLSFKRVEQPIRRAVNTDMRQTMNPVWKAMIEGNARRGRQDQLVLGRGARIAGGNPPSFKAAQSSRRLSGGLVPAESWAGFEFGAAGDSVTTYRRRSLNGGSHDVTRHTERQLPARYRKGRVVFPAVAEIAPRVVSYWVQSIVRHVMQAAEGKA